MMKIKIFMIIPDKTDNAVLLERWRQAEEALFKAGDGFSIERIGQNDVLALGKTTSFSPDHIFVSAKFEGQAFDHLLSLGCRVYGAPFILQCIDKRTSLPRRYQPIFAQLMCDVLVCCSSIDREEKERIFKIVRWLGGDYKLDLTCEVTHLIMNKVGSAKYTAFLRLNKPILTTKWIDGLWEIAKTCYPFPSDVTTNISSFTLPAFAGLVICTSGLKDDERRYFKQLVEKHGGVFTGQLKQNECTHLIVREMSGEKWKFASQWGNVKIVSPAWLLDSVHADCCLPEENYVLYGPRPPLPEEIVTPPTEVLAPQRTVVTSFMNNCSIYLYNQSVSVAEELKKMIATAGGMYVVEPLEMVTHVIASEKDLNEVDQVVATNCSIAHIVSPEWVRQSFAAATLLDESRFDLRRKSSLEETSVAVTNEVEYADISVAGMQVTNCSFKISDNSFSSNIYRHILLDGFRQKSDKLNEAVTVLQKLDCTINHLTSSTSVDAVDVIIVPFGQAPSPLAERFIKSRTLVLNSLFFEVIKNAWERHTKSHRTNTAALQPLPLQKIMFDFDEQVTNPLVTTLAPVTCCLENCCVTLTGFDYPERALLVRLVIALGAAHQEMFARTATASVTTTGSAPSMQLQRSTHLVAAKPVGEKFEKAKRWQVPVVKREWLLDCWRCSRRLLEENYSLVAPTKTCLDETAYTNEISFNKTAARESIFEKEDIAPPDVLQTAESEPADIPPVGTPQSDEKSSISRRLDAILASSKLSADVANRRSRPSPIKTPKTPLHHESNFIAPRRPAVQPNYGVESSQSLQVMWGDDSASTRYSLGIDRIEEEGTDCQPPSAIRLKSLTLVEDAMSSPNGSLLNATDNSGHPKSSPHLNGSSNSEPVLIRAPDAVVIAPTIVQRNAAFQDDRKMSSASLAPENISRAPQMPSVFHFSGLSPSERDDAAALLERLGAKVASQVSVVMADGTGSLLDSPLDASCTHLIVSEPSRTQKFLSAIAGGKWILHRSYIDACRVENRLVEESPFEWGSDRCAEPPPTACKGDMGLAKRLAAAARRWRFRLSGNCQKAFSDWRVILLIFNQQTEQSCRQILIAGGANVISLPVDYSPPAASSFTYWLVDTSITQHLAAGVGVGSSSSNASPAKQARFQLMKRSHDCLMRYLALCGGPEAPNGGGCVVKFDFLQAYLLMDPIPSSRQFFVNPTALALPLSSSTSPGRRMPNSCNDSEFVHADKRLRTGYTSRPQK